MDDAEVTAFLERIDRLCEHITETARECANLEHLNRIIGALECVFMSGHDDIDYDEEDGDRRPDA